MSEMSLLVFQYVQNHLLRSFMRSKFWSTFSRKTCSRSVLDGKVEAEEEAEARRIGRKIDRYGKYCDTDKEFAWKIYLHARKSSNPLGPLIRFYSLDIWLKVKSGTKIRNVLGYALKEFPNYNSVVWTGVGQAIGKTISCVELFKRKHEGLHQVTKLRYTEWVEQTGVDRFQ